MSQLDQVERAQVETQKNGAASIILTSPAHASNRAGTMSQSSQQIKTHENHIAIASASVIAIRGVCYEKSLGLTLVDPQYGVQFLTLANV